jgi:predicted RNA-binding protein YlqC (UPF0109 family)
MQVSAYLETILKPFLTHPDYLEVTQVTDDMGVLLCVKVHADDMGLVIGQKGETAKAVRTLVRVLGMSQKKRVSIRIMEPNRED